MQHSRPDPSAHTQEYLRAQDVIEHSTASIQDGASMIYVRELPGDGGTGGYVLVVKATRMGRGLWVTSFRRLNRSDAIRSAEIARLLKKGQKK